MSASFPTTSSAQGLADATKALDQFKQRDASKGMRKDFSKMLSNSFVLCRPLTGA
jgi:hypothetical protein